MADLSLKRQLEEKIITTTKGKPEEETSTAVISGPVLKKIKIEDKNGSITAVNEHSEPNDDANVNGKTTETNSRTKVKGMALVKLEYLIDIALNKSSNPTENDDAAEVHGKDNRDNGGSKKSKNKKQKGQNKERKFGSWGDAIKLCNTRAHHSEFSPAVCNFGANCKMGHDLREYLESGKRRDLDTFGGNCPVWEAHGRCHDGWKCRFVGSHSKEIEHEDGRKELVLTEDPTRITETSGEDERTGVFNIVGTDEKLALSKRRMKLEKSEKYFSWLEKDSKEMEKIYHKRKETAGDGRELKEENRAQFIDPPLLPSEKRRIYFNAQTPVLAPLTTQGNLPFRRMCVEFGAQVTYSEMAFAMPLVQGQKNDWALLKAHATEISPPRVPSTIVKGYDNSKDLKFGAQIESNQVMPAMKATEALTALVPHLRVVDLNCGCPIDVICKDGGGSALLDSHSKLEKMVRGMNIVSQDIPITVKIRMGTKDSKPTANQLIERMAFGGLQCRDRLGAPGCAAITLHGRSKQQRYTKDANWEYIAQCAALVKSYNEKKNDLADTIREPDARTQANTPNGNMYFIGNGDCYSHVQYLDNIQNSGVDSIMIARGALVKPWIFEEIEKGDYIDKSATERLSYIEKFARYGLEAWGSDEMGVGLTRRFLLEWLSFAHRYVPVGILDHLPPSLQDRPPAYRSRDDLETLLASENYIDWIKISEMFLGPAHKDFTFVPKHKSNAYEAPDYEAEG
ncbi:tRNA-dihydrouridine(47) synthase [NAD(P)(+)] [Bisporella sp. PMI_857]|nr:tRNA-dihydrouridine(47) synthase [NAD(P)(+)] [Bisporella sp. PMI_857]